MFHEALPYGKQIKYAVAKGIPYLWFAGADGEHKVKDLEAREERVVDLATWRPERSVGPGVIRAEP